MTCPFGYHEHEHACCQIVKDLKKSIEYYKPMEQGWEEGIVLGELQKIYEGKEKTVRHHYGGRPFGGEKDV